MEEILFRLLNNDPNLVRVDLSNKAIDLMACMQLCLALAKNTQVRYLDLSNNPLGQQGWLIVAEMLKVKKNLVGLKLRNTYNDNGSYNRYYTNLASLQLINALLSTELKLEGLDLANNVSLCEASVR